MGEITEMTAAELRTLFLFEKMEDDKLDELARLGRVVRYRADHTIFTEREPGTCFIVLLDGTFSMSRPVRGGGSIEVNRTDQRGAYAGGMHGLLTREVEPYGTTVRTVTECTLFELPVDEFGALLREWYPMAVHMLSGLFTSMRASQAKVDDHERLVALGSVTAGLTHELNNPAAAVGRANASLREHVQGLRRKLAMLADGSITREKLRALTDLQEELAKADPPSLTPMEVSDREDELGGWLEEHHVPSGWDLAPVFVAAGFGVEWAERVRASVGQESLANALHWLGHSAEAEALLTEIEDASGRISDLLTSAKQYSQMDRAPSQRADLHVLLDSTLAMLKHKIDPDVRVVTDYDRSLPELEVRGAELNQVWSNLIDNALDAMNGSGTLTVRTARDGECALVEIGDTGPGVPEDAGNRIFEPFFSTKPVGKGTGLGLDISWRIIVQRHGGTLSVESRPGDTRFRVRLPLDRRT